MRPALLLAAAAVAGIGYGVAPSIMGTRPAETVNACRVVDGDTLNCGGERIRLLGIDAPELPGHCREGRDCAPGDPYSATQSLSDAIGSDDTLSIDRVGEDRYGRTLAMMRSTKGDLSCWQLAHHAAIYKPHWDNGLRVARACPSAVL